MEILQKITSSAHPKRNGSTKTKKRGKDLKAQISGHSGVIGHRNKTLNKNVLSSNSGGHRHWDNFYKYWDEQAWPCLYGIYKL